MRYLLLYWCSQSHYINHPWSLKNLSMTEYDYCPEAFSHFTATQDHIAKWLNNTAQHAPEFQSPFNHPAWTDAQTPLLLSSNNHTTPLIWPYQDTFHLPWDIPSSPSNCTTNLPCHHLHDTCTTHTHTHTCIHTHPHNFTHLHPYSPTPLPTLTLPTTPTPTPTPTTAPWLISSLPHHKGTLHPGCQLRPTVEGARGPMVQGRRLSEQERSARNPTLR